MQYPAVVSDADSGLVLGVFHRDPVPTIRVQDVIRAVLPNGLVRRVYVDREGRSFMVSWSKE